MTKREFLDTVFALAPTEANAIMDAFDEYVDSNEPHWIPVTERLPKEEGFYLVTLGYKHGAETNIRLFKTESGKRYWRLWGNENITAWMPLPEPFKGGDGMSRLDENLELIKVTDKTTEMLKLASTEERESILKGINVSILLDISRSLAVIADALRKDEVTP